MKLNVNQLWVEKKILCVKLNGESTIIRGEKDHVHETQCN